MQHLVRQLLGAAVLHLIPCTLTRVPHCHGAALRSHSLLFQHSQGFCGQMALQCQKVVNGTEQIEGNREAVSCMAFSILAKKGNVPLHAV